MILDDIADYLTSGGMANVLTNGFDERSADGSLALYETGGFGTEHTMGNTPGSAIAEQPRIMAVARSTSYAVARGVIQQAFLRLDGLPERTINGTRYFWGQAVQSPYLLSRDAQGKVEIAFNVDILKGMSTTS